LQAGVDGAEDAFTFGLGNKFGAATGAALGFGPGQNYWDRYNAIRAQQDAKDLYETQHYPVARNIGAFAGAGAILALSDGLATAPAALRLAPQTARLAGARLGPTVATARVVGGAAGAGAGVSLASQSASDLVKKRFSGFPTYAGGLLGGAAGGAATLYRGPGTGGAVEAMVNHAAQAALNRQPLPWSDIQKDAAFGGGLSLLGGVAGAKISNDLSREQKKVLGETLSELKSHLIGEKVVGSQKGVELLNGRKTIADHVVDHGRIFKGKQVPDGVEAKFGYQATLSKNQRQAVQDWGKNYGVDHFLPEDIGKFIGGLFGIGATQAHSNAQKP